MYKKIFSQNLGKNKHLIHLWDDNGYQSLEWNNQAYKETTPNESTHKGLNGEYLIKIKDWDKNFQNLHFHDMPASQKFLIEKYGDNDTPSSTHREVFFDIEIEMGGALTEEYISSAPKPVTSIAWYDKQADQWTIVILDKKGQLKRTKTKNKEIIPVGYEADLLDTFLNRMEEIQPDILIGYNSDYFDIPYLYYRMCRVLGTDQAKRLSPIGIVEDKVTKGQYWYKRDQFVNIAGLESLDYMRLHKKYSWEDEPSWKLDAIGEKYVGINKIEYSGSLDRLFEEDIYKFIQYNFVDVEILVELDKKLQYLALTKNLSHKGKINYSEVYSSSKIHDGAISAYLISQKIIPPGRPQGQPKPNYAGGYLFCPKAGLYKYMFDEDLTSLYPSIIMSLNIGQETLVGRIIDDDDRNNKLGLNDLKDMDPECDLIIKNAQNKTAKTTPNKLIKLIETNKWSLSANGCFFKTDKESVLSTILNKWFDERVIYKNLMKDAYKLGNKEEGEGYHIKQHTQKILLNSLYGCTALANFRYGLPQSILSEAITLSGWRIICESALCANIHINNIIKGKISKEEFIKSIG